MKTDTYTPTKIETWPVQYEAVKVWRETTARQCYGRFVSEGGFCALGVLGDGTPMGGVKAARRLEIRDPGSRLACPKCDERKRIGFDMVTHWNDGHRLSFKEIADLAEAYPHLVFTS